MRIPKHPISSLACAIMLFTTPLVAQSSSSTPSAAPSMSNLDRARTRFDRGVELYRTGAYGAALVEFKRTYELAPNPKVLYNIGQTCYQLADFAGALDAFEKYMRLSDLAPEKRAETATEIEKLRGLVAKVQVIINEDDAEVRLDDVVVGTSPISQPIIVNTGRHRVSVSKNGRQPVSKTIDLASSEQATLRVELSPAPDASSLSSSPAGTAESSSQAESGTSIPWIGWGITAALAAGAVTTGILASKSASDLDAERNKIPNTQQALDDASGKTKVFSMTADILAAAAVIGGGVSLYYTLKGPTRENTSTASMPHTDLAILPTGVALRGAF